MSDIKDQVEDHDERIKEMEKDMALIFNQLSEFKSRIKDLERRMGNE